MTDAVAIVLLAPISAWCCLAIYATAVNYLRARRYARQITDTVKEALNQAVAEMNSAKSGGKPQ